MFPNDTLLQTEILTLQANAFTGTISSDIGRLSKLEQFDLVLSNVQGSIPTEMGMCTGLQTLHITGNNALTGTVGLFVLLDCWRLSRDPTLNCRAFCSHQPLTCFCWSKFCYTQIPSELGNLLNLSTFRLFLSPLAKAIVQLSQ
jgi:hypothetical protein